jgi:hypothetical protein
MDSGESRWSFFRGIENGEGEESGSEFEIEWKSTTLPFRLTVGWKIEKPQGKRGGGGLLRSAREREGA